MGGDAHEHSTPDDPADGEPGDGRTRRRSVLRALGASGALSILPAFHAVREALGSDGTAAATPASATTEAIEATEATERTETTQTTAVTATTGTGDAATAGDSGTVVEVAVGPEGARNRFVPRRVTVPVGGTVRWRFETGGHNVSARPRASPKVRLPPGAEPFSSYPPGESFVFVPEGATYEHRFFTPGTYVYVSVPDVDEGMVGTVVVTDRSRGDAGDGTTRTESTTTPP